MEAEGAAAMRRRKLDQEIPGTASQRRSDGVLAVLSGHTPLSSS
jgi:hypothetical protein